MEIPVRMIQVQRDEDLLEPRHFYPTPEQQLHLTVPLTMQTEEKMLKKWFTTIQLEKELLNQQIMLKNVIAKVHPELRIVVIKVRDFTNTISALKRIIRVPEFVNIKQINVQVLTDKKVILIKAPYMCTPTSVEQRLFESCRYSDVVNEEMDIFKMDKQEQQLMEYEPMVYKLLKHLRRNIPRHIVPRCVRDVETGMWKIQLDVSHTGFHPEELRVVVNEMEKCLLIKAQREHTFTKDLENIMFPRTFSHELAIPSWFNMKKINWFKLTPSTLRIELPIVKLPTIFNEKKAFNVTDMYNQY
jgi:hypothetical protein